MQKLTDKVLARDYHEYKREARADELQQEQIEIEMTKPQVEEKKDDNYLWVINKPAKGIRSICSG